MPERKDVEDAVRTLIRWAGNDPNREGLLAIPSRVASAFTEWFAGYGSNPTELSVEPLTKQVAIRIRFGWKAYVLEPAANITSHRSAALFM